MVRLKCELDGEGGEDKLKKNPVLKVSRTEGGPELSRCEHPLRNYLRNCAFPRSSKPIQPVDVGATSLTGRVVSVPGTPKDNNRGRGF